MVLWCFVVIVIVLCFLCCYIVLKWAASIMYFIPQEVIACPKAFSSFSKSYIPVGLIKEVTLTYKLCLVLSHRILHIFCVP